MKKISFKKALASVAALSVVACMAAIPANAVTPGYQDGGKLDITIDHKELDIKEIGENGAQVPIYVRFGAASHAISAFEFGTMVDNRCEFEVVPKSKDAQSKGGEGLDVKMTVGDSETKGFSWLTFADSDVYEDEMNVVLLMVTVPANAKVGDKYDIKYDITSGSSPELLRNDTDMWEYVGNATDGYILIVGEEESSVVESSEESSVVESSEESSAVESSEESSAAESSDSTADSSDSSDSTGESSDSTGESSDSTGSSNNDSNTSSNGGSSSNTSSGSGSPKTGSSDVLPIAGAAAAVAVLGGVALVAKKKND